MNGLRIRIAWRQTATPLAAIDGTSQWRCNSLRTGTFVRALAKSHQPEKNTTQPGQTNSINQTCRSKSATLHFK